MKSNYKRLGNYIRQVDVRNRDLVVNKLLGLSIAKQFITSIANTTGTDMSTYKIVQPRQFGYVPVTSRNGDKITIALYEGESPCIISQAYIVFEVIDETELLPEYLMMWFRRPEFDRYARFKSHGSAREVFEWSEMCDVMLPVPPIEEQRKIVSEYQAIEQRIENNRRLITTLEETAKAIYRKMFVDDVDSANLPDGWKIIALENVAELSAGGDRPAVYSDYPTDVCNVPIFSNGIDKEGLYGFTDKAKVFEESVTVSARGTVGYVFLREKPYVPIVRLISVVPNTMHITAKYLLFALSAIDLHSTGTSQQQITVPDFKKRLILVPNKQSLDTFMQRITPLFNSIKDNKAEIESLLSLQVNFLTLLSR